MLTGKLVRVRNAKDRLIPSYIDPDDAKLQDYAGRLLELYRTFIGRTRGEVEEELREAFGDNPTHLVEQGLAKLLEDRCEYEVDSENDPAEVREKVFLQAAVARKKGGKFDRSIVLADVAAASGISSVEIDRNLFADLKSEQRMTSFDDFTTDQLLHRYNVALAQAILLRSSGLTVEVFGESANRYRQLIRKIKFHRLICDIQPGAKDSYKLKLDGPLSLFSSTSKYGLQLAFFLPSLLQCKRFELTATVRWGADRKEKSFILTHADGLKSHLVDTGDYVPKELQMFADSFRKSVKAWNLSTEADVVSLPSGHWAPDFQLIHKPSGTVVRMEVLGFWRRTDAEKLFRRLSTELKAPFVLAVSDSFNIDEELADDWGEHIYRFKKAILPSEVVKLVNAQIKG